MSVVEWLKPPTPYAVLRHSTRSVPLVLEWNHGGHGFSRGFLLTAAAEVDASKEEDDLDHEPAERLKSPTPVVLS
ncbi:MAG: hypothetical protein JW706_05275, partial [Opitutales bacterium]|nr:hypothetical protein [Opitutales bacterium]